MKKITFALLLLVSSSYSQFHYGAKAGALFSNYDYHVDIAPQLDAEMNTNIYGGLFGEYLFGKFGIGLEANYSKAGYKTNIELRETADPSEELTNVTTTTSIDILAFYLTAKYYPIKKLGISFGGYYGSVLSAKTKEPYYTTDLSDTYSKSDYGLVIGTEYSFYKGLFVELKYTHGLKNYFDRDGWDLKSRMFGLGIGYKF